MKSSRSHRAWLALLLAPAFVTAPSCKSEGDSPTNPNTIVEGTCRLSPSSLDGGTTNVEVVTAIPCTADFLALASVPVNADIPGARSVKVVLDTTDGAQYFQNSVLYKVHYDFVSTHLPGIEPREEFNSVEYYRPDRRFLLGAVTYYEEPKVWALEMAPYDTASAAMIEALFRSVKSRAFFGPGLELHPTSDAVAAVAKGLPSDIPVVTTDELYAGIDYQPLVLSTGVGKLRFQESATIDEAALSYTDIVVIDAAPNDIPVVEGLISQAFQTPLSHVNVLSSNRKTPNMGLRDAMTNPALRALEGKLVELTVGASTWEIHEVTEADARAYWDAHKPTPVTLPAVDESVTDFRDIEDVTPEPTSTESLRDNIKTAVLAFGGKAAHYSVLSRTANVPVKKAFAIPAYWYFRFMDDNGFFTRLDAMLADPSFQNDSEVRAEELADLRNAMLTAPVDAQFTAELMAKLAAEYPDHVIRFRTSTNSEDLDGFPCAGCYDAAKGDPSKGAEDVLTAIRSAYSSIWKFRTFEERSYYGVDHRSVGMALLVHENFPDDSEKANGVAVTNNPFDESGLEPAFYVNAQYGSKVEVVAPTPGTTSDQFLLYFGNPNQPVSYLAHSNIIAPGTTVLSNDQIHALGVALDAIHARFSPAYGPGSGNTSFYAMDVEFKFSNEAGPSKPATLCVKQARPYPGRGN